jgi:hypothetical protein
MHKSAGWRSSGANTNRYRLQKAIEEGAGAPGGGRQQNPAPPVGKKIFGRQQHSRRDLMIAFAAGQLGDLYPKRATPNAIGTMGLEVFFSLTPHRDGHGLPREIETVFIREMLHQTSSSVICIKGEGEKPKNTRPARCQPAANVGFPTNTNGAQ